MRLAILATITLALLSSPTNAQPAQRAQLTAKFRERLAEIAKSTDGVVGIGVIDLGAASASA